MRRARKAKRSGSDLVPVSVLYIVGTETFALSKKASPLAMAPFHAHALSETIFHEVRLHVNQTMGR